MVMMMMAQGSSAGLSYHRQRAMGMTVHPRGSPAHLIYKLRRVTEDAGTLPAQLDSKELSATHRTKLRNIILLLLSFLFLRSTGG